jgi:hypothetical protein
MPLVYMPTEIKEEHIALVRAVNEALSEDARHLADERLSGFRLAVKILLPGVYGLLLMDADLYYLDQGIDRPMCCGVFLTRDAPEGGSPEPGGQGGQDPR